MTSFISEALSEKMCVLRALYEQISLSLLSRSALYNFLSFSSALHTCYKGCGKGPEVIGEDTAPVTLLTDPTAAFLFFILLRSESVTL